LTITTASATTVLAQPLALACGVVIPNRLAKAALSEQLSDRANRPTDGLVRLYERWAAGGAGLHLTGNVMVDGRALEEPRNVVVEDERDMPALRRWAQAARAHGAQVWVQLSHPGRQSLRLLSPEPVAPSAVPMQFGHGLYARPRALETAEIPRLVARFATAAAIVKEAGFTGVQVHAAHGYLISQFLSPLTNQRTDAYGGGPENRRRFLLEVIRAVRANVGPGFPIAVKLNSADFQRGGFTEEESLDVVRALDDEGVDLIEVSGGCYESAAMMGVGETPRPSTIAREAYFQAYCERVRAVSAVPLMLTGGFRTAEGMAQAIRSGAVDLVGLGRPLCVDPDLPNRLLAGAADASSVRPRRVGVRELDTILEVFWYTQQLHRLAAGKPPRLNRNAWVAIAQALGESSLDAVRRRRPEAPAPGA
jgi:2,4-dienoyl-CoA reductase-like NADH-dependent reductase (Old Yellow Enzyme family)